MLKGLGPIQLSAFRFRLSQALVAQWIELGRPKP
jgi:hypothetical protein